MVLTSDNWCLFDVTAPVRHTCYSGRLWTVCLPTAGCNRTGLHLLLSVEQGFRYSAVQEANWSVLHAGLLCWPKKTPIINHGKYKDYFFYFFVQNVLPNNTKLCYQKKKKKGFLFLDTNCIIDIKSFLHIVSNNFSWFSPFSTFQFSKFY